MKSASSINYISLNLFYCPPIKQTNPKDVDFIIIKTYKEKVK